MYTQIVSDEVFEKIQDMYIDHNDIMNPNLTFKDYLNSIGCLGWEWQVPATWQVNRDHAPFSRSKLIKTMQFNSEEEATLFWLKYS